MNALYSQFHRGYLFTILAIVLSIGVPYFFHPQLPFLWFTLTILWAASFTLPSLISTSKPSEWIHNFLLAALLLIGLGFSIVFCKLTQQDQTRQSMVLFVQAVGVVLLAWVPFSLLWWKFDFTCRALVGCVYLQLALGALFLSHGTHQSFAYGVDPGLVMCCCLLVMMWIALHGHYSINPTHRPLSYGVGSTAKMLTVCLLPAFLVAIPLSVAALSVKTALSPHNGDTSNTVILSVSWSQDPHPDPYWRAMVDMPSPQSEYDWKWESPLNEDAVSRPAPGSPKKFSRSTSFRAWDMPVRANAGHYYTYRTRPSDGIRLDGTHSRVILSKDDYLYRAYEKSVQQNTANTPPDEVYRRIAYSKEALISNDPIYDARTSMPRTYALVSSWVDEGLKDRAMVDRALEYFNHNLTYHFDHQSDQHERNRVDHLVFVEKKGVCRHFANAFVMMMRMSGLHARLVVGWRGGKLNPKTKQWEVRVRDGHAWAEVWLPGEGWVRIDPTNSVPVEKGMPEADRTGVLASLSSILGQFSKPSNGGFSVSDVMKIGSSKSFSMGSFFSMGTLDTIKFYLQEIMICILVLMLIVLHILKYRTANALSQEEAAWRDILARLYKRGYTWPASGGPETIGLSVGRLIAPTHLPMWLDTVQAYETWKFGHTPQPHALAKLVVVLRLTHNRQVFPKQGKPAYGVQLDRAHKGSV